MSDVETNILLKNVPTRTHQNVSTVGVTTRPPTTGVKRQKKEIQKIKVVKKLSYAEATKKWRENESATKIPTEINNTPPMKETQPIPLRNSSPDPNPVTRDSSNRANNPRPNPARALPETPNQRNNVSNQNKVEGAIQKKISPTTS